MKKWTMPALQEMDLSETAYGGKTTKEFDDVYKNAEGKWEGTFKES